MKLFFLVMVAASMHATWNFLTRKYSGNLVILWLGLLVGSCLLLPAAFYVHYVDGARASFTQPAILCIGTSALIHAVYIRLLAHAYCRGEISVVYPIARGTGIALVALLAWVVLREQMSMLGIVGILFILFGIFALGSSNYHQQDRLTIMMTAILIGVAITAYSVIDKIGVGFLNPVVYICSMFILTVVLLFPYIMFRQRFLLRKINRQDLVYIFIIGVGIVSTYLLILFAFTFGQVSYVVALRESAVLIGALLGFIYLQEHFSKFKLLAIGIVTLGLVCLQVGQF